MVFHVQEVFMFLSSLPGTNRKLKQHSVITMWQLSVKLAVGYWVPTETWNSTQLLLNGKYLLYWMPVTGYPQKHATALSYYHVAITCYTGCWLLGTHRNMKQHSVITTWQLPVILDAGYWAPTETWNSNSGHPASEGRWEVNIVMVITSCTVWITPRVTSV